MTFTLFEDNPLSCISPEDLAAYLSARGWLADASSSPYARVWHHGESPDESTEVIVPTQRDIVDYKIRVGEILRGLQSFESRSKSLIAKDILLATCDVVRMRRPTASPSDDSIALKDGAALVKAAVKMMTSAACSAVTPRPVVPSRRPPLATDYMSNVRMGQTERGSYILTIISKVAPQLTHGAPNLLEYLEVPFPRKVTQSLSKSLAAVEAASLAVGSSGDFAPFLDSVSEGVTANLCEAIRDMVVSEIGESEIDLSITWAPSAPIGNRQHMNFSFKPTIAPMLNSAAEFLRQAEPNEGILVTGVVVSLHREEESQEGRITVSCVIDGSVKQLQAYLDSNDYNTAIVAHGSRNGVMFRADIAREGRSYVARNLSGLRIIDS